MRIVFLHRDEIPQEYENVIDLAFDTKTAAGRKLGKRLVILIVREGLSTEEALFTIASGEIHTHTGAMLQQLANTEILQHASGHEIHLRVLPNGDIPCQIRLRPRL